MTSSINLISVSHFQNWGLSLSFPQLVPSFENGITRLVTDAWLRSPITGVSLYSLPVGEVWAGRCSVFYTIRAPFGQQDPNSTNIKRQPMRQAVISNYDIRFLYYLDSIRIRYLDSICNSCDVLCCHHCSRKKLFQFLHRPLVAKTDEIKSKTTFIM